MIFILSLVLLGIPALLEASKELPVGHLDSAVDQPSETLRLEIESLVEAQGNEASAWGGPVVGFVARTLAAWTIEQAATYAVNRIWLQRNVPRAAREARRIAAEVSLSDQERRIFQRIASALERAEAHLRNPNVSDDEVRRSLARVGITGESFQSLSQRVIELEARMNALESGQVRNRLAVEALEYESERQAAEILELWRAHDQVLRELRRIDDHNRAQDERMSRIEGRLRLQEKHRRRHHRDG